MTKDLRIRAIVNGTTIDHIPPGRAWKVLSLLEIPKGPVISVAMHVNSAKMGKKDLIYVEDFELNEKQIQKIALVAENATLNIIRNSEITEKKKIALPSFIDGVLKCPNPTCISNHEKIPSKFHLRHTPTEAKCHYCEFVLDEKQMMDAVR